MNYNIHELKAKPTLNWLATFRWQTKLSEDELREWFSKETDNFTQKFPNGTPFEKKRYLMECGAIIEREYLSIHLPHEL